MRVGPVTNRTHYEYFLINERIYLSVNKILRIAAHELRGIHQIDRERTIVIATAQFGA